ncbi:adenine nucleotide transporter BT1, chloroplastic/mitochondrial-like protein [Tanacetum coccineum]
MWVALLYISNGSYKPNGIGNDSLRRLISGALVRAVSQTCVAPLETRKTHLMVGSYGHSTNEVSQYIMQTKGWTGLFRGNLVNVICVAPSKAIELNKRVEIISHDQGYTTMSSCVSFTDGGCLIGEDAKRLIGRRFSDAKVQEDMKVVAF